MQGLPFDESDFPPAVSVSSTWMDASPRFVPPAANAAANVTEEELYGIVAATPQPLVPPSSSLPMYAQQQQQQQQQQRLQQHHLQPQHPPPPRQHRQQQSPMPPRLLANPSPVQHSTAPMSASAVPIPHPQQPHIPPPRRQRVPPPQPEPHKAPMPRSLPNIRTQPQSPNEDSVAINTIGSSSTSLPGQVGQSKDNRKPVRSAVEEARLRAQHEAETFANSRRDPTKREASYPADAPASWEMERRPSKRAKNEIDPNSSNEGQSVRKSIKLTHDRSEEGRGKLGDESEAEKQERYKRRLDMNRESAAVSRVRRRAYVKELEERLAAVEAEKLQLEGKLEVMQSQNESFKKQLDNLFMLVASGRRPTYDNAPTDGS